MNRLAFISEYTRINRAYEVQFMPLVKRAIHAKVMRVIAELNTGGYDAAMRYLQTDMSNEKMAEVITRLYLVVGRKHAQVNYSRLLHDSRRRKSVMLQLETKGFGFNAQWADFITNYLKRFLTTKITFDIAATTRDALLRTLGVMVIDGLSVDGAIEKLTDWPYERFQAARIVRTEVNRAANTGAKAQASTSEWQQWKEWISAHDNRVRGKKPGEHANHVELDAQKINEDDVFVDSVNGDRMDFPGDPSASAASVINCRCAVAYTYKRDAAGNLIPKRKTTTVIFPNQQPRPRQIITV